MQLIWISLIILANVFVYLRKIILTQYGYKVSWFVIWGDWGKLMNVIEKNDSRTKRKVLLFVNLAPFIFFIAGILLAIFDWLKL